MSNILTGIIRIVAPGSAQAFSQVQAGTAKTAASLRAIGPAAATASTGLARIASFAGPLLAFAAIGFVIQKVTQHFDKLAEASKKLKEAQDKLQKSIEGVFGAVAKEATEVGALVRVLKSETETRSRKLGAIKELQQIQPEIFKGLKLEGDAVVGLDAAYTAYILNLKNVIAAKIIQIRLEAKVAELLKLQGVAATRLEQGLVKALKGFKDGVKGQKDVFGNDAFGFEKAEKESSESIGRLEADIRGLFEDLDRFSKGIKIKEQTIKVPSVKIEPAKIELDLKGIDIRSKLDLTPPPDEVKAQGLEFGQLFYSELKGYFERTEPFDLSVQLAIKDLEAAAIKLEELRRVGESIGAVFTQAFDGLFDSINNGTNAIEGFFKGMVNGLKQVVAQLITAAAVAGILSLLGFGSFTGLFKGILGIAGKKADGGPVSGGQTYLVGERGPELFTPSTGGGITPNHQLGGRGSSVAGGMAVQVSGQFLQRGQDLLAVIALANQSSNRLGG